MDWDTFFEENSSEALARKGLERIHYVSIVKESIYIHIPPPNTSAPPPVAERVYQTTTTTTTTTTVVIDSAGLQRYPVAVQQPYIHKYGQALQQPRHQEVSIDDLDDEMPLRARPGCVSFL